MEKSQLINWGIYFGVGLVVYLFGFFTGISCGRTKERKTMMNEFDRQRNQQMWSNYFNQFRG